MEAPKGQPNIGTSQPSSERAWPPPLEKGHKLPGCLPSLSTPRAWGPAEGTEASVKGVRKVGEAEKQVLSITGSPEAPIASD